MAHNKWNYFKYIAPFDIKDELYMLISNIRSPVSSTGKVSDSCIRDLGFNPLLHQKLISVLVW